MADLGIRGGARLKVFGAYALAVVALIWSASSPSPARAEGGPVAAPAAPKYYVPEVPADMGPVEFYLMTIGLGDEVAARFGHTGIRIKNPAEDTDVVFNWGKFYFEDASFLWKFFRGELDYSMGVRTFNGDVSHYMQSGQRLTMEKLNLTDRQKRRLMEKIAWNAVPENRTFRYQYWYKNCATIPRDYINEVVEGQIRARYFDMPTTKVFRDYVRSNLSFTPFVAPLLDIFMNSNIDKPVTAWDEMFLPGKLRENLLAMPAIDDEGNPIPGSHLLSGTEVLLDREDTLGRPFNDYLAMMLPTALLLAAALVLFLRRPAAPPPLAYRLLGASTLYWGLLSGGLGLTLLLNWAFSGHPDGWHNINLLVFWPVDFLFVPIGWALLRAAAPVKDRYPFLYAGRILCYGHLAMLLLLACVTAAHVTEQNIWRVAAWFGLPMAVLGLALVTIGLSASMQAAVAQEPEALGTKQRLKPAR